MSDSDAGRIEAITKAAYAGDVSRNPEEDVRFLLRVLARTQQERDEAREFAEGESETRINLANQLTRAENAVRERGLTQS